MFVVWQRRHKIDAFPDFVVVVCAPGLSLGLQFFLQPGIVDQHGHGITSRRNSLAAIILRREQPGVNLALLDLRQFPP